MVLWLGRNCSDPAVSQNPDDCSSAGDLLPTYGLTSVPDLACFRAGIYSRQYTYTIESLFDRCFEVNFMTAALPGVGTCPLPEAKANRILWDYVKSAEGLPEGLVGWSDYTNPDSDVIYMTIRFPLDLKAETFYTSIELAEPFGAIDD